MPNAVTLELAVHSCALAAIPGCEPVWRGAARAAKVWLRTALLLALISWFPVAHALTLTDARGVTVRFDKPPQRIVSLLPSLTETVCALGACDRLVGVDRYSDWPASVRSLPSLGGGLDPSIEAVVALHPDLVLLAGSSRAAQRLQSLHLTVFALEPENLADMQWTIGLVGQIVGTNKADALLNHIESSLQAAADSLPAHLHGLPVYFEVNNAPYAAGASSFIGEILSRLGVRNIVGPALGPFPKLNPEFVVRANPSVIMLSEGSATELAQRPGWSAIRAVRENRICAFNPAQVNIVVRPGPRMAEAAHILAQCLMEHAP